MSLEPFLVHSRFAAGLCGKNAVEDLDGVSVPRAGFLGPFRTPPGDKWPWPPTLMLPVWAVGPPA